MSYVLICRLCVCFDLQDATLRKSVWEMPEYFPSYQDRYADIIGSTTFDHIAKNQSLGFCFGFILFYHSPAVAHVLDMTIERMEDHVTEFR